MRYQKRRCSPPPSPHRQVVVGRGRAWTEVRRAWSYLLRCRGKRRQGRDRSAPKLRHGPECVSLGVSSTWVSATIRNSASTSVSSPSSLFRNCSGAQYPEDLSLHRGAPCFWYRSSNLCSTWLGFYDCYFHLDRDEHD